MRKLIQLTSATKPLLAALAVAGLASVTLAGCDDATGKTAAPAAPAAPPVSAAIVLEKPVAETQEFSAVWKPSSASKSVRASAASSPR